MAEPGSLPQNILASVFCMSMLLGGCGLKGDLYLEKPDTKQEQSTDTAADADSSAIDVSPPPDKNAPSDSSTLPPPLTGQDGLQETLQQGEADIGDEDLEDVSPNEEEEDSIDESAAIEAPPLP